MSDSAIKKGDSVKTTVRSGSGKKRLSLFGILLICMVAGCLSSCCCCAGCLSLFAGDNDAGSIIEEPPPLSAGQEAQPPLSAEEEAQPPLSAGQEAQPSLSVGQEEQTALPSEEEEQTGLSVGQEAQTALSAEKESLANLEIHFIDVGQADAALVICDGEAMLIDGGDTDDSSLIYTYLKKSGITILDYVIASHAHEDHVGGLAGALNYAEAKRVLCPVTDYDSEAFKNFQKYVDRQNLTIEIPGVGDDFTVGDAKVHILGVNSGEETNDTSIILKITHGELSFLFTGDACAATMETVVQNGFDLKSTLLKVGHHGSDDSTDGELVREICPEYAVISVGKDNAYGHPHQGTLDCLKDAGAQIWRTDLQGDVVVISDGRTLHFITEKDAAPEQLTKPGNRKEDNSTADNCQNSNSNTEETEPELTPPVSGNEKLFVLNTNTHKFHFPSCRSVKDIKETNYLEYKGTAQEVKALGYVGCKICNPY